MGTSNIARADIFVRRPNGRRDIFASALDLARGD
jgi:hypothetical protein